MNVKMGKKNTTLIDILRERSTNQPDQKAYRFLTDGEDQEHIVSYGQLGSMAKTVAAHLQKISAKGERVLLLCPPGLEYITAFYAILYAGLIAVPAYPPRRNKPLPMLQAIINDSGGKIVISTTAIIESIQSRAAHTPELMKLHWVNIDQISPEEANDWRQPEINAESIAFLQYTSGSTSKPKGVMLTHQNLIHNLGLIHEYFGLSHQSKGVIWLPPYHDMGLIGGILQPVFGGFEVILMSPLHFFQKPVRWLKAISKYRGTTSGGPNFAFDLCVNKISPEQCQGLDLGSWDVAFCGAEPVRWETLSKFSDKFLPFGFNHRSFFPCYGLAEATLIVTGGSKFEAVKAIQVDAKAIEVKDVVPVTQAETNDNVAIFVSCGRPIQEQKVVIVDPETLSPCSSGRMGEIWVAGKSVARGFWNQREKTEQIFQAHLAGTDEGSYLRTGDMGFMIDGELFITTRLKDLIIIRGRNYYPQDIERVVEKSHNALRPGHQAAFTIEGNNEVQLVIAQEIEFGQQRNLNTGEVLDAIRDAVFHHFELRVHDIVLLRPGKIPKTSSGKIRRNACRIAFLHNQLDRINRDYKSSTTATQLKKETSFIKKAVMSINKDDDRKILLETHLKQLIKSVFTLPSHEMEAQDFLPLSKMTEKQLDEFKKMLEQSLEVNIALDESIYNMNISQLSSELLLILTHG